MIIADILVLNIIGADNLITITETVLTIQSGEIEGIRTYSSFIFSFLSSNPSNLSNLIFSQFYPNLIYASFSSMIISNCTFSSSFEKLGDFEVCALYFEYNMSFIISNSQFSSLSNNFFGSVNIYFIIFSFIISILKRLSI